MKKNNKYFFIGAIIGITILVFIIFGSNSKFFIKRDFNQAFQYRLSGDCVSFGDYLTRDIEKWKKQCEEEKLNQSEPVRNFKVQQISHKLFSDKSFLQVELTRNVSGKGDYSYSVNYEMKKDGFKWKIDQDRK